MSRDASKPYRSMQELLDELKIRLTAAAVPGYYGCVKLTIHIHDGRPTQGEVGTHTRHLLNAAAARP